MFVRLIAIVAAVLVPSALTAQGTDATRTFYAVSYVEVAAASTSAAVAAIDAYRQASRAVEGFTRIDLFEQVGRPGHYAIVETWLTQAAFDARDPTIQKQLLTALDPIRVSNYDQRPYKILSVAPSSPSTDRQVVYVISHVDVTPNPQVPVLLQRQAEASRKEPGNLRFDVVQHTMRANHFTVIEAWRNPRALNAHVEASHSKAYRDELQPFTGSPLDERVYKRID